MSSLKRLVLLVLVLALPATMVSSQERFGDITGKVTDPSGASVGAAVVTVTNLATKRAVTITTGPDGMYYARELEPGHYSVAVSHAGFSPVEIPDVQLLLGRSLKVDAALKVGGQTEALQVVGEAPLIDIESTARGHNVPSEEFDTLPKGRSFQALAVTAPSVNEGELEGGIQVNGASAGENNYTVDGVSVNSQVHGHQRQDAVFEHLAEVQVKTSGLSAEYGGALGGVISAVTKSGGNDFHGSAFYYLSSDKLTANGGAENRLQLDPVTQNNAFYIQDDGQKFTRHEVGGSLGGPIIRNKAYFFVSASPRFENRSRDYIIEDGARTAPIERDRTTMSTFGKVSFEPSSRLRMNLSALHTPDEATGTLNAWDGDQVNRSTQALSSIEANRLRGYEIPQWNAAFTADYTLSNTALLSFRAGYMNDDFRVTGVDTAQTFEYSSPSTGIAGVPTQWQQPAGFQNLPRVSLTLMDKSTRRYTNLELTKTLDAGGTHNIKIGTGLLHATNEVNDAYPNRGFVTIFWNQTFTSEATGRTDRGTYGYYTIDDQGTIGKTGADIFHFFIQDSWKVGRKLTLDVGLRLEDEKIPTFRPDIQETAIHFGLGDKIAPRLGFAYDVRGDGKMKISGSFGRYYDWTKYELARGSFGGDVWTTRYRSLDDPDPTKLSRSALTGRNLWTDEPDSFQDHRIPSFGDELIDPEIKPMSQDAFNLGLEYQLGTRTVVGVNASYMHLRTTIEDIGTIVNGSETYIYGNPGVGLARQPVPTGATPNFDMPKPKRNYTALELTMNRRFAKNWFMGSSLVLSRLYGNYAGTVNTDEFSAPGRVSRVSQQAAGQRTRPGSNATRMWDLDEMMFDSRGNMGVDGRLPTDRPMVFKVYGSYNFDFGTNLGAYFYGGSGTPITRTVFSGFGVPVFVDGRGSMGRTDFLTQLDAYVSHDIKLAKNRKIRLEFNALNVLNQQQERHRIDFVNRVGANGRSVSGSRMRINTENLQAGYDWQARLAAAPDNAKAPGSVAAGAQDPRFGMSDIFNPGFSGRVAIRFIF
jgi:hypothetical protein